MYILKNVLKWKCKQRKYSCNICMQKYIYCKVSYCYAPFLQISTPMLQVKDNNLLQESQSLSWAVTQHVCQPFFDLVPVRLSACFNTICHCRLCACLSVCSSICSIRQSIPLVFDSWCVILSVSEWCHSGAVCQGRKPRCHHQLFSHLPYLLSPDTFQSGFTGDAYTVCVHAKKHAFRKWVCTCACFQVVCCKDADV